MKQVKLSTKIIGGFAFAIIMMALVMGIYQFTVRQTTGKFGSLLNNEVAIFMHAGNTEKAMLQCRRDEKDFLLKKKMKYPKRLKEHVADLKQAAAAIQRIAGRAGMRQMTADTVSIQKDADIYDRNFDVLVAAQQAAGLDEKSGYQGDLRDTVHALEREMAAYSVDDIYISYLTVRRYEKDFLRSRNDKELHKKYRAKYKKGIADLAKVLAASKCDKDAKKIMQTAFQAYQQLAQQFMTSARAGGGSTLYRSMEGKAHVIEETIHSIRVPGVATMVQLIRHHEKDYLLRFRKEYVVKTHKAVANLYNAFANSRLPGERIKAIEAQLDTYNKDFDALVTANNKVKAAAKVVHDTAHMIEPLALNIYTQARKKTDDDAAVIKDAAHSMAYIALVIGLIIMAITICIAFFLVRSITRPIDAIIKELAGSAEQVSATSGQVSSSSQTMAEGASEQAAAIEETSATMEEMSAMTKQNSDNAGQADNLMRNTLENIREANAAMDNISQSMGEISTASKETQKIVKTIDEIAFQTNLLALNAAVEAARAGEAGAGFAVVADEVRNLAMRASEAAKNTAALIDDTVGKVNNGKEVVDQASESFGSVTESSAKIGGLVGEIATASHEQAQGFTQINQAITEMDTVTQQNAAVAEESAGAAAEMTSQATAMMTAVAKLKLLVDGIGESTAVVGAQALKRPKSSSKALPVAAAKVPAPPRIASGKPEDIIPMDDDSDFEDF